jgi:hypothetical protein
MPRWAVPSTAAPDFVTQAVALIKAGQGDLPEAGTLYCKCAAVGCMLWLHFLRELMPGAGL